MNFYLCQIKFGQGKTAWWHTCSIHGTRQQARNEKGRVNKEWKKVPFRIVQINVLDYEEKVV